MRRWKTIVFFFAVIAAVGSIYSGFVLSGSERWGFATIGVSIPTQARDYQSLFAKMRVDDSGWEMIGKPRDDSERNGYTEITLRGTNVKKSSLSPSGVSSEFEWKFKQCIQSQLGGDLDLATIHIKTH